MAVAAPTSGLLCLFRADSLSSLANGASVTSWVDSVGNRNVQTRTAAPTKLASGANGQPAVRFNGSNQSLGLNSPPAVPQPFTVVAIATVPTAGSERQIIWQGDGGEVNINPDNKWANYGGAYRLSSQVQTAGQTQVVTSAFNGANGDSQLYANGTLLSSANVGTGAMNQGVLLIGENNGRWWSGDIYEIRIYDHVLSASERAQVHSYAQDRYGMTVADYSGGGDTTAPTVPTNIAATANSQTQVTVSWTASTDAVGVQSYRVRRNGADLSGATAVTGTSFVDTTAVANTNYSYTVSAVDAAGNRSAESSAATVTTPAPSDTTAPSVPSGVTATANSATQVTVAWTASTDAVGVSSYRVQRGGTTVAATVTGTTYVDTTAVQGTSYSYTVSAVDAAGNRSAESTAATVTTPLTGLRVADRWDGSTLIRRRFDRWDGSSLIRRIIQRVVDAGGGGTIPPGSSTPARRWIVNGGAPTSRATWETGVVGGVAQVAWVGSFPDVRARTSRLETGVAAQAQDGWQAQIVDTTTSTVVADSGVTSGTAEKWVASSFTPVAGRRYIGQARVRAADGQWSAYAATRFVAPSGRVLYLEDYGAVGDGVTQSGTDYANAVYTGPIRNALKAAQPGDIVRSKAPGTVVTGLTASSTSLTSTAAVFTSAMVGKKIIIYRAGSTDTTTNSWAHRSTISAVAADGKSATLAAAVTTAGTSLTAIVGYAEYLTGHIDVDNGMGAPGNAGGWTLDGTGCIFTSNDVDHSGFRTTCADVTYLNVHYQQKVTTTRGNGKNNDTGPFFVDGSAAIGLRFIGCYAERARDAGFLIFGGGSDIHVVDSVADHTNADGFHVTGSAFNIQFIRCDNAYIGDDGVANIGYRSDGDGSRPHHITWERPRVFGQDWGRGVSQGGCYAVLVTDLYIERGAGASFILGSDGDMANTTDVQIRRGQIVQPNLRRGQKPTYSQGSGTGSTIPDEPWLKLLNSSSAVQQSNILVEDLTVADGRYIQIISYGNGAFTDNTITLRGIAMTGTVNGGTNWRDEGTYPQHIDLRGISVPSGSTPITAAPTNPNGAG